MSEPEENREKSAKTDAVLTPREVRHPPNQVPRPPAERPERTTGGGGEDGAASPQEDG